MGVSYTVAKGEATVVCWWCAGGVLEGERCEGALR